MSFWPQWRLILPFHNLKGIISEMTLKSSRSSNESRQGNATFYVCFLDQDLSHTSTQVKFRTGCQNEQQPNPIYIKKLIFRTQILFIFYICIFIYI